MKSWQWSSLAAPDAGCRLRAAVGKAKPSATSHHLTHAVWFAQPCFSLPRLRVPAGAWPCLRPDAERGMSERRAWGTKAHPWQGEPSPVHPCASAADLASPLPSLAYAWGHCVLLNQPASSNLLCSHLPCSLLPVTPFRSPLCSVTTTTKDMHLRQTAPSWRSLPVSHRLCPLEPALQAQPEFSMALHRGRRAAPTLGCHLRGQTLAAELGVKLGCCDPYRCMLKPCCRREGPWGRG